MVVSGPTDRRENEPHYEDARNALGDLANAVPSDTETCNILKGDAAR